MAEQTITHIGENSAEQVAYKLFATIAGNEGKRVIDGTGTTGKDFADKQWVLDTYAECLKVVKDPYGRR